MSKTKDFDTLKRKVYLAYHQDGILDLTAAVVLLGFGIFMLTGSVVFLSMGAIFAALYTLMKQRITIPRFGYVRFEPQEKTVTQYWLLLGLGVIVLLAFLGGSLFQGNISPEMQALRQQYHMVSLSAMLFGLPALAAAVFLGLKRFYLYAFLAVGLPALGGWLNIETYVPILAIGFVMLVVGIGLLSSFLKKYPGGGNDNG
ncbi:MAG: hypothetical protein C3F07_15665 [Anaerolineales bacterium]|nr:hypothetical protein [Anaerolineae bacterium]PWB70927.1 MAG: hypothetical protein C3F07_15665 [Anaerolineales bacterium]